MTWRLFCRNKIMVPTKANTVIIKAVVICALLAFYTLPAFSQSGTVYGKVIDETTGETLPGAAVYLEGNTQTGTSTDIDGNFILKLPEGVYNLKCSYVSYQDFLASKVNVKKGESVKIDFVMKSSDVQLEQVVVEAVQLTNTDASLIAMQKKSIAVQDGISSQQISRTGSTNAAESMKQMTGASVQDGKYLVMRGLGDRYSISQLNGVQMSSADPYRNSSSLDLIPSSFIDNIVTLKTFTPDQPGSFTGGNVDITTKNLPEKFMFNFGYTLGYNSLSNLRNDFLTSEGPASENFGFPGSQRSMPSNLENEAYRNKMTQSMYVEARNPKNPDEVRTFFNQSSKSLNNSFIPETGHSPLNQRIEISAGNRFKLFNKDFGFIVGGRYSDNYNMYKDGAVTTWINNVQPVLFAYQDLRDSKSVRNPQAGAFANLSARISKDNQVSANLIYSNDAEITGRQQFGSYLGQVSTSNAVYHTNSIQFTQRELITTQVGGKHHLSSVANIDVDWSGSYSKTAQEEPDFTYFAYTTVTDTFIRDINGTPGKSYETEYYMNNAEYSRPYHFFRRLDDELIQGKVDITAPLDKAGKFKIKTGAFYAGTNRDFKEYRYELSDNGIPSELRFTEYLRNNNNDLSTLFQPNQFGIIDTTYKTNGDVQRYTTGYYYVNQTLPKNFYSGEQVISAAYLMGILSVSSRLKVIAGARVENTDIRVNSQDTADVVIAGEIYSPKAEIRATDVLPSLNLVYQLNEKTNLRASATKTLARPNMREISPFVQFDSKNGFYVLGNPSLQRTLIQNYDLRYEFFPKTQEMIAVGAYTKIFDKPIVQAFNNTTIPELIFINVDKAYVYGIELEVRKSLEFIHPFAKDFALAFNCTFIHSEVDMPEEELKTSRNFDSTYSQTVRPFVGQAPYIFNIILQYINKKIGNETSLSFNVSGKKLNQIALVATPDIYEKPVPMLNFKTIQRLDSRFSMNFTVQNMLNSSIVKTQDFKGKEYITEKYPLGVLFQAGIAYTIK